MNAADFMKRLDAIPIDFPVALGSQKLRRSPIAVQALCNEALYSISLNGDPVSRWLAVAMLKAMGMKA